jgi:pyruvate/2-oxoglutarate dehydrogenase complex dihydrolipoamide acyltransferase (E2) component
VYSKVRLRSWPWARKVLVPVGETVTLGEVGGLAGAEAGVLGDPDAAADVAGTLAGLEADATAALIDELQAATSKAIQATPAQPATCRARRPFALNMISIPQLSMSSAAQ